MSDDPTGYKDALAEIPENQLSTRAQKIGAALAMIRDGSSCLAASKACGVPNSTLHRYHQHISKLGNETGDGMGLALEDLQRQVVAASLIATERVTERLVDPEHEWKDSDLIKAQGVNIDKARMLRDMPNGGQRSGVDALAEWLESSEITITKKDAAEKAIDVTPEKD